MLKHVTSISKTLLVLLVLGLTLVGAGSPVSAAAPVIINDRGTVYLSTQLADTTASDSAYFDENEASAAARTTNTTTGTRSGVALNDVEVNVPKGFATTFSGLLNGALSFILVISSLLVLLYLLWGGFDWIVSGGDKGKADKARDKIVSAVIGLIIVAASFAILNLVIRFLGFSSLNEVFDSAGTIEGGADTPQVTPTPNVTPTPTPAVSPTPSPL